MRRLVAALAIAAPLVAFADSNPDASFYKKAAEAGIFEIDAGNLAQSKGNSHQVKDFGAMMVKDHTAAAEKLKSIADSKNISLPSTASIGDMGTKTKLDVLSGDTFDKSYIKSQVKAHREAVALFKKESMTGQDADAKAFAAATLPTLRSHLKAIDGIAAAEGVTVK